ncbi:MULTISPECIES: XRE family transcriptional regulator [unclassified Thomasclavelia]|uniref:XRE family transcriptional regulator n=1 Tax=unclassified Thomasclavelia TaxID=3025756 RepID=UPI001EF3FD24|nr:MULTISPECIES: XRE family transcriptional regulator [unclassified Thomasclavelia]
MNYILKQFDNDLLYFSMENTNDGLEVKIKTVSEELKHLLPLDLELTNQSLKKWLEKRTIPRNRAYVSNFLARLGLNEKDTKGIIDICQGLSLNDCYWIVQENCKDKFADKNLYTNSFNTNIASIAFTGYGSYTRSSFRSSPEFTTNGMLAKSWRRIKGKVLLYKSGTEGFANSGLEPYSEYYASQVAKTMELHYVEYGLSKWKGKLCSTCELFTSLDKSFIPIGRLVKTGGIEAVRSYYQSLGENFYQEFIDMLVFDAVILNEDRHFGNFGLLIDNQTNKIIAPAPIFDNGLSLLCYAMEDDFKNINNYIETRQPASYQDFIAYVKPLMNSRQKEKVRKLLDFHFKNQSKYRLSKNRLKQLEIVIQQRAVSLLD